jgi:hypothetical protein
MNNNEEIFFNPELGIDADLEPLLAKEGVTILSLRAFGHWRRGFTEEEIGLFFGISHEEAESCIADVQKRISPERMALDEKTRDEIITIKEQSEERFQGLQESLSQSATSYIKAGRNPAVALRDFRESITPEGPCLIPDLRKQDCDIDIDEKMDESTLEAENRLIAELRQNANRPFKNTMAKDQYNHDVSRPSSPARKKVAKELSGNNSKEKRPDRRITFRLGIDLYEKLGEQSTRLGLDRSFLVREAVKEYLDRSSEQPKNQVLPPEIFELTMPFRAWSGDLRVEQQRQFMRLLALSSVTAQFFPKTKGTRESYTDLLSAYQHFKDSQCQTK